MRKRKLKRKRNGHLQDRDVRSMMDIANRRRFNHIANIHGVSRNYVLFIARETGFDPKETSRRAIKEKAQEKFGITPTYKVLREWGPDHAKHFIIGVFLRNKLIAEGEGSSKQEAEEAAAKKALERED